MFSLPHDRKTRPLSNPTRPLFQQTEQMEDTPTASLPVVRRTTQLLPEAASTGRTPIVISAHPQQKQRHQPHIYQRRPFVFVGVLISSILIVTLGIFFVSPLDNGQGEHSVVQSLQNWFSTSGQADAITTTQYSAPPTATPALMTSEGSCGGTDIWGTCATNITASGVMGTGQMQRPLQGAVITQLFAHPEYQQWCGCVKPHSGIDLAAPYGTPITAADSGQVIWVGWDWSGLGWAVKINHGHYIATVYGHLQRYIVKVGQNVNKGDVIAYEGSTGASTGPHLHFMVVNNNHWVDPMQYMQLP